MELITDVGQKVGIDDLIDIQKNMLSHVIGIEPKRDQREFYYSISGVFQEAIESLEEDTRWKEIVFRKPGYKYKEVNLDALLLELTDIMLYWMNALIHAEYNITCDLLFTKILRAQSLDDSTDIERVFAYRKKPVAGDPMAFYEAINTIVISASNCLRKESPDRKGMLSTLFISIIDAYVAAGFNAEDLVKGFVIKVNQKIEKFRG